MKKVNLTKILRLFPQGAVLYSPMLGNVVLKSVWENGIQVKMLESDEEYLFDAYGVWKDGGDVMLLPNGFSTDWSEYNPDIQPGDVVIGKDETRPFMFLRYGLHGKPIALCGINYYRDFVIHKNCTSDILEWTNDTYLTKATTLQNKYIVNNLLVKYNLVWDTKTQRLVYGDSIACTSEKFDITTLQPFDKVLVRDRYDYEWCCHFFSHIDEKGKINLIGYQTRQYVIPYNEETKHLVGTKDKPDDKYVTWKD